MSNPWKSSVEEVALRPLIKFLDNDQRVTTIAAAELKQNKDPTNLITKLRLADQRTKELHYEAAENKEVVLQAETIIANNLAKELSVHLRNIKHHFELFNTNDALKLSMLHTIKSRNLHRVELSSVNRAKLIECIKVILELLPKVLGMNKIVLLNGSVESLVQVLELLNDANELVPTETLYDCIVDCTEVLNIAFRK